jgi:hypothetical protein
MAKLFIVPRPYQRDAMQRRVDPKVIFFASFGQSLIGRRFDEIYITGFRDLEGNDRERVDEWIKHAVECRLSSPDGHVMYL